MLPLPNYFCSNTSCGYKTTEISNSTPEELDEILEKDGGFMKNKKSLCPKCKENSLVYIHKNYHENQSQV